MRIKNIDINKFIPLFMRDDECVQAIAAAINDIVAHIDTAKLRTWDK